MSKLTLSDLISILDKNNPAYGALERSLRIGDEYKWLFAKKNRNLVEVVQEFISESREPIIDKGLGIVIGANAHLLIRAHLCCYHNKMSDGSLMSREEIERKADLYIKDGFGYFFSSMTTTAAYLFNKPDIIKPILSRNYKPDLFDKDLFKFYNVDLLNHNRY